jgi:hypothetical protein
MEHKRNVHTPVGHRWPPGRRLCGAARWASVRECHPSREHGTRGNRLMQGDSVRWPVGKDDRADQATPLDRAPYA